MDVVKAVETYITKMVSTPNAMKVLLLDSHTVSLLHLTAPTEPTMTPDTNRISCVDTINTAFSSSILDGQDRQQEAGENGTHEMCVLSPAER